ncbi:MAG: class I SAM-dependent methyltransferase [Chitinophagaceae bacterium]|nr:class I SAM-dependent methyltransferase [Chitinophagaceae bacterium]
MNRDLDQYFNSYQAHEFETVQAFYRRKKVLEIIKSLAPKSILEVGSGAEPLFTDVDVFNQFCVVEPTSGFFQEAEKLKEKLPAEIQQKVFLYNSNIEEYANLAHTTFDLIIVSGLLHEVEFPDKILEVVGRLCSPNTTLHINVPNAWSFHRMLAVASGIIPSVFTPSDSQKQLQQHHTFDMERLAELVVNNGFTILDSGSFFIKPFTHSQMQQMLMHKIIDRKILDGLFALSEQFPQHGSEIFVNVKHQ